MHGGHKPEDAIFGCPREALPADHPWPSKLLRSRTVGLSGVFGLFLNRQAKRIKPQGRFEELRSATQPVRAVHRVFCGPVAVNGGRVDPLNRASLGFSISRCAHRLEPVALGFETPAAVSGASGDPGWSDPTSCRPGRFFRRAHCVSSAGWRGLKSFGQPGSLRTGARQRKSLRVSCGALQCVPVVVAGHGLLSTPDFLGSIIS